MFASQELKDTIDGLFGFHESPSNSGDKASEHPLVSIHPETGERVLNISPLTLQHVVGLSDDDSERLLGKVITALLQLCIITCLYAILAAAVAFVLQNM